MVPVLDPRDGGLPQARLGTAYRSSTLASRGKTASFVGCCYANQQTIAIKKEEISGLRITMQHTRSGGGGIAAHAWH